MALGPVTQELGGGLPCPVFLKPTVLRSLRLGGITWDLFNPSTPPDASTLAKPPTPRPPPNAWMPAVACSPSGHGPHKLQSKLLKCNSNPDPVLLKALQCLPFALGTRLARLPLSFKASATWTLSATLSNLIHLFLQMFKGSGCFSEENKGP